MKNSLLLSVVTIVIAFSCSQKTEVIPAFQSGKAVGLCNVGASAGRVSVLVQTNGQWRIRPVDDWLTTDSQGGKGMGAFTFSYGSNQSDVLNLRPGRVGRIAICLEDSGIADTLIVAQRGFLSKDVNYQISGDSNLKLEFDIPSSTEIKLLIASSKGASEAAVSDWADSFGADIRVIDGSVTGDSGELNIVGCNFDGQSAAQRQNSFLEAVDFSIEQSLVYGNDWIVCGQMYHYSAMQVGYSDTPSWYPSDASSDEFQCDRYAWQNNLYDILWMKTRGWVETYTDEDGHNWQADYMYVSGALLDKVSSIDILPVPVPGMRHKPLSLVLKY